MKFSSMKTARTASLAFGALVVAMVLISGVFFFAPSVFAQIAKVFPDARNVGATREIHVDDNGKVKISGLYVEMVSGTTMFTKLYWGDPFLRIAVRTTDKTVFSKRYGTTMKVADIQQGHYISAEGTIVSGSGALDIDATSVKDWSISTDVGTVYTGTITGTGTTSGTFLLATKENGVMTLRFLDGAEITKGQRTIPSLEIMKGDRILGARGTYNYTSRILDANVVQVYQDQTLFVPKVYIGALKSISSVTLPTTLVVTIDGKDYSIYVPASGTVLNATRQNVSLRRFVVGDTIRLSGKIRPTNFTEIDADVIRNINI